MKEIRTKSEAELQKLLASLRVELRGLRVKASAKDLKNVKSIRQTKQVIARLLSHLASLKKASGI
jgi:ribosomal protein L29